MKARINNVGKIKDVSINLNKKFTLFCGPNNSGKTFASYCIYGFGSIAINDFSKFTFINDFDEKVNALISNGELSINSEQFADYYDEILHEYNQVANSSLKELFGTNDDSVIKSNSEIKLFFDSPEEYKNLIKKKKLGVKTTTLQNNTRIQIDFFKEQNDFDIVVKLSLPNKDVDLEWLKQSLKKNIVRILINYLLINFIPSAHFIPAERLGVVVFGDDILNYRFSLTNSLDTTKFTKSTSYAKPIQDAITSKSEWKRYDSKESFSKQYLALAEKFESKVLKGKLEVTNSGEVYFIDNDTKVEAKYSGSNIKSLIPYVFYLKYHAYPGQLLIFDEPEQNLHPDNQRLLARSLVELSNLGIKILVSSHSDYFIKELNNVVILNKDTSKRNMLLEKYNYSPEETIYHGDVGCYVFDSVGGAEEVLATEQGVEPTNLEKAINSLNIETNNIFFEQFDEE